MSVRAQVLVPLLSASVSFSYALGLHASGGAGGLVDGVVALGAEVRGAVGVAVDELGGVSEPGRDDDAAEVVDGFVERQKCGLLTAVSGGRGDEGAVDLARQLALDPEAAGGIDELLELGGYVADACGGGADDGVRPLDVGGVRQGDVRGGRVVGGLDRVGLDRRLRGELGGLDQPDLGPCRLRRLDHHHRDLADGAGGGVLVF